MKLIFMTTRSPLSEDHKGHYSRIRFYADTIIKFAERLRCSSIEMLHYYCDEKGNYSYIHHPEDDEMLNNLYRETPEKFENCHYLERIANSKGIVVHFSSIDKYLENTGEDTYEDAVAFFGILNGYDATMNSILDKYFKVIKKCTHGYYYLSSDGELTIHQYIEPDRIGFLNKLGLMRDPIMYDKLRGIIVTEIDDPRILDNYENIAGISRSKVMYLPLIINTKERFNPSTVDPNQFAKRTDAIMILRNFDRWSKYPEWLDGIRDHFHIYESSMPAIRKRYINTVNEYGGVYKHAKFWTTEKMRWILSGYRYYYGMSTPGTDRFTYKIIEASDAGTVCILPKIHLNDLGISDDFISSKLLRDYQDIMIIDMSDLSGSMRIIKDMINNATVDECIDMINRQREFVLKYFDYDSDNINECMNEILKKG